MRALSLWVFLSLLNCSSLASTPPQKPALQLANTYSHTQDNRRPVIDLSEYWVSEKYDGVRAYWNGRYLLSRSGRPIPAPEFFTDNLPDTPLDGELWLGRQRFEEMSGLARSQSPQNPLWREAIYMVFDAPAHPGTFRERYEALKTTWQKTQTNPTWRVVLQNPISSEGSLLKHLSDIEATGGEGLMLRKIDSHYINTRNNDLIKLKSHHDAEATVIGYKPGKGKYKGLVGALKVQTPEQGIFYLGSGLSDHERKHPPQIGDLVTYKYYGLTNKGKPRFASFLRVREPLHSSTSQPASN